MPALSIRPRASTSHAAELRSNVAEVSKPFRAELSRGRPVATAAGLPLLGLLLGGGQADMGLCSAYMCPGP